MWQICVSIRNVRVFHKIYNEIRWDTLVCLSLAILYSINQATIYNRLNNMNTLSCITVPS